MTNPWHRAAGDPLDTQAEVFANEITSVLKSCLPGAPEALARKEVGDTRYVIGPVTQDGKPLPVPLHVDGEHLADLVVSMKCSMDTGEKHLAVDGSRFLLSARLDRTPILRIDFVRRPDWVPASHLQVHAHRGALSHILSRTGHPTPHSMEALHLPLGGPRFRPCLEDFLQFLIRDCRFDSLSGWEDVVQVGRERWRCIQVRTAVRDAPEDAAEALRALGYDVNAPPNGAPPNRDDKLRMW